MDHAEAVRSQATEKYLLGTLGGGDRDAFEAHFFDCGVCAEEIRLGLLLADNAAAELRFPAITRVGVAEGNRHDNTASWKSWFRFERWQGAFAVPAMALVLVSGLWVRDHHRLKTDLESATAPQAFSSVPLDVARGQQAASVARNEHYFAVSFYIDGPPSPAYSVEIQGNGSKPANVNLPWRSPGRSYNILLPVARYRPGRYEFLVRAGAGANVRLMEEFSLNLE